MYPTPYNPGCSYWVECNSLLCWGATVLCLMVTFYPPIEWCLRALNFLYIPKLLLPICDFNGMRPKRCRWCFITTLISFGQWLRSEGEPLSVCFLAMHTLSIKSVPSYSVLCISAGLFAFVSLFAMLEFLIHSEHWSLVRWFIYKYFLLFWSGIFKSWCTSLFIVTNWCHNKIHFRETIFRYNLEGLIQII